MKKRVLGKSGLEVSAIGFGCMGLNFGYGQAARQQAGGVALIRAAVERGVTFFDTAEVYGPFTNEEMVGEALAPVRDQVVIATKFGFHIDPATGKQTGLDSRPAHIREVGRGLAEAARRSRCIDLLYQHRVDPEVPIEDVAGAVRDLIARGQGQAFRPVRARRANHPPRPCGAAGHGAAERIFALDARAGDQRHPRRLRGTRHRLVAYSPLGKGFLTGAMNKDTKLATDDFRAILPRFTPEAMAANQALVDLLEADRQRKSRRPRRRSRWPGCWRKSPGSCRSPAPPSCTAWRKISAPRRSS